MAYATVDQLAAALRIQVTAGNTAGLQGCLDAAAGEIDSYLGWNLTPPGELSTEQQALVTIVNVDRAAEHWRLTPYGALQQGPELPPVLTARNSWYRHARKLAPLVTRWGVA